MFGVTVTERCHMLLRPHLHTGDLVVDCTAGNGHDTRFLARCVGPRGKVLAFEIQEQAANKLRKKIAKEYPQVMVVCGNFTSLEEVLRDSAGGEGVIPEPAVIVYNLGWLPGGDHSFTTKAEETIASVRQALRLVKPEGVVSIITYPGHEEGLREEREITALLSELPSDEYEALTIRQTNRGINCPVQHIVLRRRLQEEERD
ncbi:MAG: class I SAM-dependent methyltransferase [Mogibacterium sp.]|nr:class I SAM-dependent methyltransferase [Mogibacterium sp.]